MLGTTYCGFNTNNKYPIQSARVRITYLVFYSLIRQNSTNRERYLFDCADSLAVSLFHIHIIWLCSFMTICCLNTGARIGAFRSPGSDDSFVLLLLKCPARRRPRRSIRWRLRCLFAVTVWVVIVFEQCELLGSCQCRRFSPLQYGRGEEGAVHGLSAECDVIIIIGRLDCVRYFYLHVCKLRVLDSHMWHAVFASDFATT